MKLTASRIRNLRKRIKTWKIWKSKSMFGFHSIDDVRIYSLATRREPEPDAIIYGYTFLDALKRFAKKHPLYFDSLSYSQLGCKAFARIAALPNHGRILSRCYWWRNLPKDIEFWK